MSTEYIDRTLSNNLAIQLIVLAASIRELQEQQEAGELDGDSAVKAMKDCMNDLRLIGRGLEEIAKGTKAAAVAEAQQVSA